jgi:hypothetical protein
VDCISAAGSKSTAFGALVSIVKNTELFASAPSTLVLPAASLKLKAGESTTITFTLSEISTDFDTTDVVVTGGILTDFVLKANETGVCNIGVKGNAYCNF